MTNLYTVLVDAAIYDTFEIEASCEEVAIMRAAKLFEKLYMQSIPKLKDYDITYEAFVEENDND
jgi:hypothetical protein